MKMYQTSSGAYLSAKNIQDAMRLGFEMYPDATQMWVSECPSPFEYESEIPNKELASAMIRAFEKAHTLKEFMGTTPVMVQYQPANRGRAVRKCVVLPAGQPIYKAIPVDARKASVRIAEDEVRQIKLSTTSPYIRTMITDWLKGRPKQSAI